jgi:hypothetical protein
MRILLLAHSFNSLTQRLWVELTDAGHELSLEFDVRDSVTIEAVRMYNAAAQQVAELEDLISTSRSVAYCTDLDKLCRRLLVGAERSIPADAVSRCWMQWSDGRPISSPPPMGASCMRWQ